MDVKTFIYNWLLAVVLGSFTLGIMAFMSRFDGISEVPVALLVLLSSTGVMVLISGAMSIPYVIACVWTMFNLASRERQMSRIWLFHWVGSAIIFALITWLGVEELHWLLGTTTLPFILFGAIFLAQPRQAPKWFPF